MTTDVDHPLRHALVNELHARPFPVLEVPCRAVFAVVKEPLDAANRDRARDRAHLLDLLDRHGAAHPPEGATHYTAPLGPAVMKWESHTEFVTYTAFLPGLGAGPFDPTDAAIFPEDWLEAAPGKRLAAAMIRVEPMPATDAEMLARLDGWLVPESLTVSRVVDGAAVVAGDFRIDAAGQMRFAVFVRPGTGARRVGRIVQRVCEIETYRAASMLGLMRSRALSGRLNALDPRLSALVAELDAAGRPAEAALHDLLAISSELESLAVSYSFRFGATSAYEAIVHERVAVLRESRIEGRQSFGEFMMRRYDPAMRTVKSAERRLQAMAERAERAADLLRTRVDVERSAQNQALLESMDRRADLALRLQHTVEGLSVVAISYYGVNLAAYLLEPLAHEVHLSHGQLMAVLVPVVVGAVWFMVRRIRKSFH